MAQLITSDKGMVSVVFFFVFLSICLVATLRKSVELIAMEFYGGVRVVKGTSD